MFGVCLYVKGESYTEKENDLPTSSQIHPVPLSPMPMASPLFTCKIHRIRSSSFQDHAACPRQFLTTSCSLLKYLTKCWPCDVPPKHPCSFHSVNGRESELVLPALKFSPHDTNVLSLLKSNKLIHPLEFSSLFRSPIPQITWTPST